MGGGVTQIVMPAIAAGFMEHGSYSFSAWRWAFFIPGAIYLILGVITFIFAQVICEALDMESKIVRSL